VIDIRKIFDVIIELLYVEFKDN